MRLFGLPYGRLGVAFWLLPIALAASFFVLHDQGPAAPASAAPDDVSITALSCDTSPEYVRIKNFGSSSQSLAGFHLQSDPSQDYDLAAHVSAIADGETLEFQSGTGAAENPGAGIYKLTGSPIYRNSDPTDYARLVRSDTTSEQVNCGSTPATPTPTPTATATPTPTATPTATPSLLPIQQQLGACLPVTNVAWSFNNQTKAWSSFDPDLPPALQGFTEFAVGGGYFLNTSGNCTISAGDSTIPLYTGWNLFGWRQAGLACGSERWAVKTLSDPGALSVNFSTQPTTVAGLRALAPPASLPETGRIAPTELTVFTVRAEVQQMKLEDDRDFHVVIADPAAPGDTMIVELPDPACSGAINSSKISQMKQARQAFVDLFGQPTTSFTPITGTVDITGVGFFDFIHGQTGVAPNGIELHPVLAVAPAPP